MKIGILDSGIGGINVLNSIRKYLPNEEYFYYADVDNVPYGNKSDSRIIEYVNNATLFLLEKGIDILCIACNTASSVAAAYIREKYSIPVIAMEPAVCPALKNTPDNGRILLLATPVTISHAKLKELLIRSDEHNRIDCVGLVQLPEFAERGIFDGDIIKDYLDEEFKDLNLSIYSGVILGCTHFNYFENILKNYFGDNTLFFDGNDGTARNLYHIGLKNELKSNGDFAVHYYDSGKKVSEGDRINFLDGLLIK